jgi:hypothetical protein
VLQWYLRCSGSHVMPFIHVKPCMSYSVGPFWTYLPTLLFVGWTLVLVVVGAKVIVILVLIVLLVRILIADRIAFVIIVWCLVLALTDNVIVVCYNNFVTLPQNVTFITVERQFAHISCYLARKFFLFPRNGATRCTEAI